MFEQYGQFIPSLSRFFFLFEYTHFIITDRTEYVSPICFIPSDIGRNLTFSTFYLSIYTRAYIDYSLHSLIPLDSQSHTLSAFGTDILIRPRSRSVGGCGLRVALEVYAATPRTFEPLHTAMRYITGSPRGLLAFVIRSVGS